MEGCNRSNLFNSGSSQVCTYDIIPAIGFTPFSVDMSQVHEKYLDEEIHYLSNIPDFSGSKWFIDFQFTEPASLYFFRKCIRTFKTSYLCLTPTVCDMESFHFRKTSN